MTSIKERIELYIKLGSNIKQDIQTYLSDKDIDLEERWSIFELISEMGLLVTQTGGDGHLSTIDIDATMYDDFNTDRYCRLTYVKMYKMLLNRQDLKGYTEDMMNQWREVVLSGGADSFIHDW